MNKTKTKYSIRYSMKCSILAVFILLFIVVSINPIEAQRAAPRAQQERNFALNFKDIELSEFLTVMSQLVGKNIVIDEKVRGKITISSSRKVPIAQAYDVMKSILNLKGFSVIENENFITVVPVLEARQKNIDVLVDGKDETISLHLHPDATITYLQEIKHANVNDVSNAIRPLKAATTEIIVYLPLNTLILTGNAADLQGLIRIIEALDKEIAVDETAPEVPTGNIHVVHLENANAVELAEVLSRVPFSETAKINTAPAGGAVNPSGRAQRVTQTQTAQQQAATKLSIIANKATNSLIITATPDEFIEIKKLINELDSVREQVLIEAHIIEVAAENNWSFGVNWMLGGQSGIHQFGGSAINSPIDASAFGTTVNGKTVAMPLASGFQLGYLPDTSVLSFMLMNASAGEQNFNILSSPQIMTIDNQEAEINVGEEIAFAANARLSDAGTTFYTYEYKTVGIKLKIKPHITKGNKITLDLYQEMNSILGATTESATKPPDLGKRDIKTQVSIENGKTIVIGGLIQNRRLVQESKVPVLGDIPLLGWLFKQKNNEFRKTNLFVFITPHIVTDPEKLDAVTRQKQETQRRLDAR